MKETKEAAKRVHLPIFDTEEWNALPAHVREVMEWTLHEHAKGYHYLASR